MVGIAELRAAERSRFHSAGQCVAQPQPGMGGRWPAVERSAPAGTGWPYGAKPAPTPILKGCGGVAESVQRSKRRGKRKKTNEQQKLKAFHPRPFHPHPDLGKLAKPVSRSLQTKGFLKCKGSKMVFPKSTQNKPTTKAQGISS